MWFAVHSIATDSKGNVFTVERSSRSLAAEFPAKDAPAAQQRLRDLADKRVYLHLPDGAVGAVHVKSTHGPAKGRWVMVYRRTGKAIPEHVCEVAG